MFMPSPEINKVREYWDNQANAKKQPTIEEMRLYDDYWATLTGEPGEVDYVHTVVGGIPALWAVPKGAAWDRVILCFHGGGFMMGSRYSHRKMYGHLAKAVGCRAAYRGLLELGVSPAHVLFSGDSAGGGLAIGAQLRARDAGLPLPAGAMTMSAWTDMTLSGASYDSNKPKDSVFRREMVSGLVGMLLGQNPDVADPYASPISADLTGLPPIYLQAGGDEGLLDDSVVFAERASKAGVKTKIDIFPDMLHSFQMAVGRAPEADDAVARLAVWARPILGLAK
jgi:epsilon-lactone hydrolase